jgi:hypothetical protein
LFVSKNAKKKLSIILQKYITILQVNDEKTGLKGALAIKNKIVKSSDH